MGSRKNIQAGSRPAERMTNKAVQALRVKTWHSKVKSLCNYSNYRLDLIFDLEYLAGKRTAEERQKIFESAMAGRMSAKHLYPSDGPNLIRRVDEHPRFAGTASIYYSPLWPLLDATSMNVSEAAGIVANCFNLLGLYRPTSVIWELTPLIRMVGRNNPASDEWLQKKLPTYVRLALAKKGENLDTLALVGALFREAYLSCVLPAALGYEKLFSELLDEVSNQPWLKSTVQDFLPLVEERVLFWHAPPKRKSNSKDENGSSPPYDDWEFIVVQRPVFIRDEMIQYFIDNENMFLKEHLDELRKLE